MIVNISKIYIVIIIHVTEDTPAFPNISVSKTLIISIYNNKVKILSTSI